MSGVVRTISGSLASAPKSSGTRVKVFGSETQHEYINGLYDRVDEKGAPNTEGVDAKGAPLWRHADPKVQIWIYEDNDHVWRIAHEMAKNSVLGGDAGYAKADRNPAKQEIDWEVNNKAMQLMPWDCVDWMKGVDAKWSKFEGTVERSD